MRPPLTNAIVLLCLLGCVAIFESVASVQTQASDLSNYSLEGDVWVVNTSIIMASEDILASGQTKYTPIEATDGFPLVNSTLTKGNFVYEIEVKERSPASWGNNGLIVIEAFSDGILIDGLFAENVTAEAGRIEGVTVQFDLGKDRIPDSITVYLKAQLPPVIFPTQ